MNRINNRQIHFNLCVCFVCSRFRLLHNTKTCDTCDVLLFVRWCVTTYVAQTAYGAIQLQSCSKRHQLVLSAWSTQFRRLCRFPNCANATKSRSGAYNSHNFCFRFSNSLRFQNLFVCCTLGSRVVGAVAYLAKRVGVSATQKLLKQNKSVH